MEYLLKLPASAREQENNFIFLEGLILFANGKFNNALQIFSELERNNPSIKEFRKYQIECLKKLNYHSFAKKLSYELSVD